MRHVTAVLYHNNLPPGNVDKYGRPQAWHELHCQNCGLMLMKVTGRSLMLTNGRGLTLDEIPLGVGAVQHMCRGCKTLYTILWQ